MTEQRYPPGWDQYRTERLIDRYDSLSEDEQMTEDEDYQAEANRAMEQRWADVERRVGFQESIWKWIRILIYFSFAWLLIPALAFRIGWHREWIGLLLPIWGWLSFIVGYRLEQWINEIWKHERSL